MPPAENRPRAQLMGPTVAAFLLTVAVGLICWLGFHKPGRYVFGLVYCYGTLLCIITWCSSRGWLLTLPGKPVAATLALLGYSWSFQLILCWILLGLPRKYSIGVHLFELWIAVWVCVGIRGWWSMVGHRDAGRGSS